MVRIVGVSPDLIRPLQWDTPTIIEGVLLSTFEQKTKHLHCTVIDDLPIYFKTERSRSQQFAASFQCCPQQWQQAQLTDFNECELFGQNRLGLNYLSITQQNMLDGV